MDRSFWTESEVNAKYPKKFITSSGFETKFVICEICGLQFICHNESEIVSNSQHIHNKSTVFLQNLTTPEETVQEIPCEIELAENIIQEEICDDYEQSPCSSISSIYVDADIELPIKLLDAMKADPTELNSCTLILCEGDAACDQISTALHVLEDGLFGIFALQEKLLNTMTASKKTILDNKIIQDLIAIIGLDENKTYLTLEDVKTLRYTKILLMTDMDEDGTHIQGLFINFIYNKWPELLKFQFIDIMLTPIIKVKFEDEEKLFYSLHEYEEWENKNPNLGIYIYTKVYNSLETSSTNEIENYFRNIDNLRISLTFDEELDGKYMKIAFAKNKSSFRKFIIDDYLKGQKYLNLYGSKQITCRDFIETQLVRYWIVANGRRIPNLIDGLTTVQRKIIYYILKSNSAKSQMDALADYAIHEMRYQRTSQILPGSNNLNLLKPNGNFVSVGNDRNNSIGRHNYNSTEMTELTPLIFHVVDNSILKFKKKFGIYLEPEFLVPIIPLILINLESTIILKHNPETIINILIKKLNGEEVSRLIPWYKNFNGTISEIYKNGKIIAYKFTGSILKLSKNKLEITNLPPGTSTHIYITNCLKKLILEKFIINFIEKPNKIAPSFIIRMESKKLSSLTDNEIFQKFKLIKTILIEHMNVSLFDEVLNIKTYVTHEEIFNDYFQARLQLYAKRKAFLVTQIEKQIDVSSDRSHKQKLNFDLNEALYKTPEMMWLEDLIILRNAYTNSTLNKDLNVVPDSVSKNCAVTSNKSKATLSSFDTYFVEELESSHVVVSSNSTLDDDNFNDHNNALNPVISNNSLNTTSSENKFSKSRRKTLCDTCGKNFSSPGNLKTHMSVHTKIKNFVCHVCGLSFRLKNSLQEHAISHEFSKILYACPYCPKRFEQKSELNEHIQDHTQDM